MYLAHLHLNRAPFQEEPDPTCFFPGADRKTLLQSLFRNLQEGRPLIKVIGREGSGKTLLCRVLVKWLPAEYEVISLDNPIGDFDDLMRLVCLDLGMDPASGQTAVDYSEELRRLLEYKKEAGKKVILLVDEAEKLFMAALERLVRTPGELPPQSGLSIVLAGRPGLDVNLEQLSGFCDDIKTLIEYKLQDLSPEETRAYLDFRLRAAGLQDTGQFDKIFPESTISKIYKTAQGNIRMINILAEESLQVSFSQKSFMVLLDRVAPEADGQPQSRKKDNRDNGVEQRFGRKRLAFGLVGFLLLMLAIFWIRGQEEQPPATEPQKAISTTDKTKDAGPDIAAQDAPRPGPGKDAQQKSTTTPQEEEILAKLLGTGDSASSDSTEPEPDVTDQTRAEDTARPDRQAGVTLPDEPEAAASGKTLLPPDKPEETISSGEARLPPDEGLGNGDVTAKQDGQFAGLASPEERLDDTGTSLNAQTKETARHAAIAPLQGRKPVALAEPRMRSGRSGADIVRERQQAGSAWLNQPQANVYTLQLMHLSSAQAGERLAGLLTEQNYASVHNQLYILHKQSPGQGLFLFYGTYSSREAAWKAKDTLPSFLQGYQPYPLSISDAVKKTRQ